MIRGLRSTLTLFVLFVALGSYAYFIESERPPESESSSSELLFELDSTNIIELQVTTQAGDVTRLERSPDNDSNAWSIRSPVEVAADDNSVSAIVNALDSLEVTRVVDIAPANLSTFGLANPVVEISFRTENNSAISQLFIGDQTPTGSDLYAKTADSARVFLIANFHESTFNRTTFELRDKAVLDFDGPDVEGLFISSADFSIRFNKNNNVWQITEPMNARADFGLVEGLIGRLGSAEMQSIEFESNEYSPESLEPFGLTDVNLTVSVETRNADDAVLEVGSETPDGSVFSRDASRNLVFTIDNALATDLGRTADSYRQKDLFSFRPFNATQLDIEYGEETKSFEKQEASDGAVWTQVGRNAEEIDQATVEDLLTKLSALRAQSFVDSQEGAGLDSPLATIEVSFDDTNERVLIGRSGEKTYGVNGNEHGAAVLDAQAVDELLNSIDGQP
jgi:hypothetical protein